MSRRILALVSVLTVVIAVAWFAPALIGSQAPAQGEQGKNWTAPKTPWGDPDFGGIWDSRTGVPLERPAEFGNREFMTETGSDRSAAARPGRR